MYSSNRRQFVSFLSATAAAASLGPLATTRQASAADTAAQPQPPFRSRYLVQPAIAAYSLRKHFRWSRGKEQSPAAPSIDMQGFIDFCAQQQAAAELTSYFFPPDISDEDLLKLKRYAFRSGVTICGTAIGNRFDEREGDALEADIVDAELWIDRAAMLGAPHIRLFAGKAATLAQLKRFETSVAAVKRCAERAAARGVMIGIENHGGITAETLLRFLDAVDSEWVGINLDTGNFPTRPYQQLRACVDRAVHVQWKVAIRNEQGTKEPANFDRFASILKEGNYSGFVAMEYEEAGDAFAETAANLARMRAVLA